MNLDYDSDAYRSTGPTREKAPRWPDEVNDEDLALEIGFRLADKQAESPTCTPATGVLMTGKGEDSGICQKRVIWPNLSEAWEAIEKMGKEAFGDEWREGELKTWGVVDWSRFERPVNVSGHFSSALLESAAGVVKAVNAYRTISFSWET